MCACSFIEVRHYVWLSYAYICICMWLYNTWSIQFGRFGMHKILMDPSILVLWTFPLQPTLCQHSLQPFHFTAGDQLVVPIGVTHILYRYKNTIEGVGGKRTNEKTLGVNSSAEGELCNTLGMCRLTLVWILAKLPQSNWNADSSSFTGLDPISCWLVSPLRCPVPTASLLSRANCLELVCPTNSLLASPSTSGHGEISSPKPFVWFRAKTDKGIVCLAGHLHSVTVFGRLGLHKMLNLTKHLQ